MEYVDQHRRIQFPPPQRANTWGMVAQGGNLSPGVLLSAYEQGIFPWYDRSPIVWFSPDPRFVLYRENFHIPRRFRRELRRAPVTVTMDHAFDRVIAQCRQTRLVKDKPGTWITPEMERAYREMHDLGYAHSVEVWDGDALVGGLYGMTVGGMIAGESMFSEINGGSKYALVALAGLIDAWAIPIIDCQSYTDNLAHFGAEEISREAFLLELEQLRGEAPLPATLREIDGNEMLRRGMQLAEDNDRRSAGEG